MKPRKTSLYSTEQRIIWALGPVLGQLGFACDLYSEPGRLLESVRRTRSDLVIVDANGHGAELVRQVRAGSLNLGVVVVALSAGLKGAEALRLAGADLICDRDLDPKPVMDALLRAKTLVTGDQRQNPRTDVHPVSTVRYSFDGTESCHGVIVDVSVGGVCIEALEGLQAGRTVHLRFELPAMRTPIHAMGEIKWRDHSGRAGIFFTQITETSRRQIERWLEAASRPFSSTLGMVPARRAAGR